MSFQKQKTKIITHRKYKEIKINKVIKRNSDKSFVLKHNFDKSDFGSYKDTLFNLLNKHVPLKKKYVRASDAPCMTKDLHKEL